MVAAASEIGAGIVLADNFLETFSQLMEVNDRQKAEFMAGDRFKSAAALAAEAKA